MPNELETVIVTAQYREQDAQKVPISLTILNKEALALRDIHDASSIALETPGMSFSSFAPGQALIAIRGIISADDSPSLDNSVAVFLDGTYIGRQALVDLDLVDVERVEILKGPQGTLFGRNAIGGAINIITRKPDSAGFQLRGTLGNYQAFRWGTYFSSNITESLSANVSLQLRQHDGFTENVLLDEDNQTEDTVSFRSHWQWEQGANRILISVDHSDDERADMGRTPIVNNGAFDYVALSASLGGEANKSTAPISGYSFRENSGLSIHYDVDFSRGSLKANASTREGKSEWSMASIGAPFNGVQDPSTGLLGIDVNDQIDERISQHQAELRWFQDVNDNWHYVAGVFYFSEETDRTEQFKIDRFIINVGQETLGNEATQQTNTTNSLAMYSNHTIEWGLHVRLQAGLRLTYDKKVMDTVSLNCGQQNNPLVSASPLCNVDAGSLAILQESFAVRVEDDWWDVSPRLAIEYFLSESFTSYLSFTKGFKSGGFGGAPGLREFAERRIRPEKVINYEIGVKSDWFEERLRVNASVFFMDYDDLQTVYFGPSQQNPEFGSFTTVNIDETTISGAELDVSAKVASTINVELRYAYLESKIEEFLASTVSGDVDVSGSSLRQAPRHSVNASLIVELPFSKTFGTLHGRIGYSFKDEQLSDYINTRTRIDQVSLVDADLRWTSRKEKLSLNFWVKNLNDARYISHSYSIGPGVIGVWGEPRTFGLTVNWSPSYN